MPSDLPTPESAPATWAEWNAAGLWPEWVPADWRKHIEEFWLDSWRRGPREWLRSAERQPRSCGMEPIPFGIELVCRRPLGRREPARGRYVHTWNNMCVLVGADGVGRVTSVGRNLMSVEDFEAIELTRCM